MPAIAFLDFTATLLAVYDNPRYARKTYLRMRQVLRELADLGVTSTAELTTATMARYVRSRGPTANANTTNGLLSAIGAACSYAVEEGWLDRQPGWRRVRPRATPAVLNRPRSYDETCRLLDHLHTSRGRSWQSRRLCALAWLVALTGVRLGEALHSHRADYSLDPPPRLTIDPARHRLKTAGSARTVPLPAALATVLADWLPHCGEVPWAFPGVRLKGPWTGGETGVSKPLGHLQAAARELGIPKITWHSLRHSFGTTALTRWDVPLWVVQRVLGHSDVRTTQRYLHTEGDPAIDAAMERACYKRPA